MSLKKKAISSFDNNIGKLIIPTDENMLQLIAVNGSDVGIEEVWAKVNPILANSKNQPQNVINSAIQILLFCTKLYMTQPDALAGNIKALTLSKCSDEKKKEILLFIKNNVYES